ncbi:ATP-binding protein [Bifidobacterium bohemicum]|uniref:ATP-binding protein n=1 Tax=Bifidobacterium bohemicum TaxID=638617 RepID=UPI001ED9A50C|nr:ATP-binding protein [Bifidobacterium bohemicum]
MRRYPTVSVGKAGNKEIDFCATDADGVHYYQVSQTVLDSATLTRELEPLQSINDNHQKTLLTLDRIGNGDHNGIKQINLLDWLLEV